MLGQNLAFFYHSSKTSWPLLIGKNFPKLDDPDSGRLSTTIQNAMKKKFGGNWFVMLCEADEYCSLTHIIGKYIMLKVSNGQSIWVYIAKYDPQDPAPAKG